MKATRPWLSVSVVLITAAGLVVSLSVWQTVLLARENQDLRGTLVAGAKPVTSAASAEAADPNAVELTKAQAELEKARTRLSAAEEASKKLAAELAIAPAEELKSLGRTEELAAKSVSLLQTMEQITKSLQAAHLAGRTERPNAKNMPEWMVNTEAIGGLEADPPDVAEVHAHALRETLNLDDSVTARIRQQLAAEFEQLRANGLDRPHRPTEGQEEWYAKRDQMLLEGAARIEAQIPAAQRKPHVVSQIMNLGTGFRTRLQSSPNGAPGLELYYHAPGLQPIRF